MANETEIEPLITEADNIAPRVLPAGWKQRVLEPGAYLFRHRSGLAVILSVCLERDGKRWLHVSCSYPDVLPSWDDLNAVKAIFVGRNRTAIQVLPPDANRVNVHPFCLHLWACLDEPNPIPDFTREVDGMKIV